MTGRDVAFWKPHRSAELAGRDIDQPLLAGAIALLTTRRIPRKAWLQLRVTCLLTSFNILVGIGVNEMILRVDLLHASAPIVGSPAVELTHFVVLLLFLTAIGYFNVGVLRQSRKKRRLPSGEFARRFVEQPAPSTAQY